MLPINSISVHNAAPTCARSRCCYHWRYETMPRFLPPPIKPVITASHSVVVRTGPTDFNWIPTLPLSLSQLSGRWLTCFSWDSYLSVTLAEAPVDIYHYYSRWHVLESWHKPPHLPRWLTSGHHYKWRTTSFTDKMCIDSTTTRFNRNQITMHIMSTIFHDNLCSMLSKSNSK